MSEITCAQWNGTLRLHRTDPSHRALYHCSCRQNTKKQYWGQKFCQMERDISVRPNEITVDWSKRTEYSSRTKPKWAVPFAVSTEISEIWG